MNIDTPKRILKTYITLTLLSTFASAFIWGVNTLFLLDAGLSITQAFAANAFFTVGQVIFEVPTGVIADTLGRRTSYLLGSATLFVGTLLYWLLWVDQAGFWLWAAVSMLLGLGFTFFSGATEAWLVDALKFTKYKGSLEAAFGKGQVAMGVAMLSGTVAGGVIAQVTNLGVPYLLRILVLAITFVVTLFLMHDVGFTPSHQKSPLKEMRNIIKTSYIHGFKKPAVRWIMLAGPFTLGVGFYAFYAMQPYLLELYGNPNSYAIAGLAAAIISATQIMGGLLAPSLRKLFHLRTTMLLIAITISGLAMLAVGLLPSFGLVLGILVIWGTMWSASIPVRQAYINDLIPSAQRATVLSSDNLISSSGGVVIQPALGKVAQMDGYPASYIGAGFIQVLAIPFILLARRQKVPSDTINKN